MSSRLRRSNDEAVLAQAQAENRILITFDEDFGELAFRRGLPASSGIILFRLEMVSSAQGTSLILLALKTRSDWARHFFVVEANRIRMTPFRKKKMDSA